MPQRNEHLNPDLLLEIESLETNHISTILTLLQLMIEGSYRDYQELLFNLFTERPREFIAFIETTITDQPDNIQRVKPYLEFIFEMTNISPEACDHKMFGERLGYWAQKFRAYEKSGVTPMQEITQEILKNKSDTKTILITEIDEFSNHRLLSTLMFLYDTYGTPSENDQGQTEKHQIFKVLQLIEQRLIENPKAFMQSFMYHELLNYRLDKYYEYLFQKLSARAITGFYQYYLGLDEQKRNIHNLLEKLEAEDPVKYAKFKKLYPLGNED